MIHLVKSAGSQLGSTLVEVLVAIGLSGIMLPALAAAIITSNHARPTATQQLIASGILQEMTAATRSIREKGWTNVSTDGTYHPVVSSGGWALASGSLTTNGFTEQIVISDVERNSSLAIVASGGTADPSTKLVTETVSWTTPTSSSVSASSYLTRWQKQAAWQQTSVADFSGDVLTGTQVTNTSGGEVQLAALTLSGTLTSSAFNAGASSALDYLTFTTNQPTGTSIKFQIATSTTNGSFSYVGPDGTSSTYFTAPATIPLSLANNQYFSYQATFSATTLGSTPVLNDVTLTYSP
jgi:Tfp pilus assembly protein PilV